MASGGDGGEKKPRPFIERKQAFAERQAARGRGVFAGKTPAGVGPPNRHGMPKLPVGQHAVEKWPVLDLGDEPDIAKEDWRLEVDGLVEAPHIYTWDEFMALPQTEDTSDFHCVTSWSRMDNRWRGVRFADIAERARPRPEARHVLITAYDVDPGSDIAYTTNLAIEEAMQPDVLLVHTWEGEPLPGEHGGPVRMITPQLYAWKGAKWIRRISFSAEDRPGFWEVRGYSNTAYPWFDDRYSR
ncbi:MAG TPA: sulfite oxidase-like oxidoreductase [Polyangiaceae bacterium]|jgi:DMSO/TMAO reductase YedYZ molybdopterin-dependent catalytic subunit|nr:sulfite oxidase-like oxidoreductase [Polyangiaceae bacterium]